MNYYFNSLQNLRNTEDFLSQEKITLANLSEDGSQNISNSYPVCYYNLCVISMIGVYPTAEIIYSTINRWKFIFQMIVSFLYMFKSNLFTDSKHLGDLVEAWSP